MANKSLRRCPNGHSLLPNWGACPYCEQVPDLTRPPREEGTQILKVDLPDSRPVVGWLLGLNEPHHGNDFRLHQGKNTIGRSKRNTTVLRSPQVGESHCEIVCELDDDELQFTVRATSLSPTSVNGHSLPAQGAILIDNDLIGLGSDEFLFKSVAWRFLTRAQRPKARETTDTTAPGIQMAPERKMPKPRAHDSGGTQLINAPEITRAPDGSVILKPRKPR